MSHNDPVHQKEDGKWYFWDETWTEAYGPYETEIEANQQLDVYCDQVLGGH